MDREVVAEFTGLCDGFAVGSREKFRFLVVALRS